LVTLIIAPAGGVPDSVMIPSIVPPFVTVATS